MTSRARVARSEAVHGSALQRVARQVSFRACEESRVCSASGRDPGRDPSFVGMTPAGDAALADQDRSGLAAAIHVAIDIDATLADPSHDERR